MTRLVRILLLCVAPLWLIPSAQAVWGGFLSTGTATGVGNPSCAFVSTDHVVCAVRTGKAAIMVNEFNGSTWAGWKILATSVTSDPSCTSEGAGKVVCAATATTGNMQVSIFNGTAWSATATVAAALFSAPSCAELAAGHVLCAARSATGGLTWSVYNGTTWTAFANLVTTAVSAPSCTTDNNGGVICAIYTVKGFTLVNRFVAATSKWQGFINIGGTAGGEPDCTSMNSAGNVVCFAKAYTSGIYGSRFNGKAWSVSDWTVYAGLGGGVNDNASCTSHISDELVCGVIGVLDGALYANVYNGALWSGWGKVGGTGVGSPACAPLGTGQVVCLIMGPGNKLSSTVGP
jgi:hypothetical protein